MAKRISAQQIAFLRYELERGDAKRRKVALQDLCALYRNEQVLPLEAADDIETRINGLILQEAQDLKVVRWGLNALARFGRLKKSRPYVETALRRHIGDPEIEAAGVAALCHMYRGSVGDIEALQAIDPTVWKLAALQNTDPKKIDLSGLKIDIYKAEAAVLRLALITVGLNRDIENLFHPKHSNNAFVRHLGQHSDDVVQQYSVWAVIENRRLAFEDLGVRLDDIDSLRPNVQAKVYQLVAERDPDMRRRLDLTEQGSYAGDYAREGLARGVKSHFYDGLEGVTLDWFGQEMNQAIRGHLAEHFARFSDQCAPYDDIAMSINEADPLLRDRLLLGAEGKPLYSKLRALEIPDLLTGLGAFEIAQVVRDRVVAATRPTRHVLMFAANPLDGKRIWLEEEQREIRNRLKLISGAKFELELSVNVSARATDILTNIINSKADVVHFSGHGDPAGLVFQDDRGNGRIVDPSLLAQHLGTMAAPLRCLVLNACFSAEIASAFEPYAAVIIGCDGSIDDDAAITFASAFYVAMASGHDFGDCFEIAKREVEMAHSRADADMYVIRRR